MAALQMPVALAALIERHGETYASLSRLLDRRPDYLTRLRQRGSQPTADEMARLAHYFRVPLYLFVFAD